MPTHFFAAPDFLGLLRFWDEARDADLLPEWRGDMAALPAALHDNLIISERHPDPVYRYVGAECQRRWGGDPTGQKVAATLKGEHGRYVLALCDETLARGAPIFSAAVYQTDDLSMIMTGRLMVPFIPSGGAQPSVAMGVQLFRGPDLLPVIGTSGFVHELRRDMIALVPALCARLEDASRYYRIAHRIHQRDIARDLEDVVRELSGSALVPLALLPEARPE
jgi:hypothetical protein